MRDRRITRADASGGFRTATQHTPDDNGRKHGQSILGAEDGMPFTTVQYSTRHLSRRPNTAVCRRRARLGCSHVPQATRRKVPMCNARRSLGGTRRRPGRCVVVSALSLPFLSPLACTPGSPNHRQASDRGKDKEGGTRQEARFKRRKSQVAPSADGTASSLALVLACGSDLLEFV